jgi:hypothetical protein
VSDPAACLWCGGVFEPHRGGSPQTFCGAACRASFHREARRWCNRAIADGRLTVEALRDSVAAACTLPSGAEAPLSQSDKEPPESTPLNPMAHFLVELPLYMIELLVKFGWLRSNQQDDLPAIMRALRNCGLAPRISRVA